MQEIKNTIEYKGKSYDLVFNLNVMEAIQSEYGTLEKWGALTDGSTGEPNARAVIYGFRAMINEGIDIRNEESGTQEPFLSLKQVGRLITEYGLTGATKALNDTVVASTKGEEKNG